MTGLDLVGELVEFFSYWRVYVCVIPAVLIGCTLHDKWPDAWWLCLVTGPAVIGALFLGLRWHCRSRQAA